MSAPTRLALAAVVLVAALGLPAAAPVRAQSTSNLDVVLAIDNSGSMRANDPDGLRWSAAQLFVDLASPGDRIAALVFASDVTPLGLAQSGRLTPIQDRASRETLKQDLAPRAPEGETNMQAAMRLALDLLGAEAGPNRRIVVFLTDGVPEPDSQRPLLAERIAEAGAGGVTVFPILLSQAADTTVAAQMVRDTGGLQQQADDPPGLLRAFGRIYTFIRPDRYADELPTTGYGLRFQTNPAQAITQVSVVVPRPGGNFSAITSLGLSGQEVLGRDVLDDGALVARAEATHYQLVTVQHNRPLAGEWVVGTGPNAGGFGLLLASSAIGIELAHPVSSVTGSFVAPRRIPAGRPALLIARVTQNGGELGDLSLSVFAESGQTLPLESRGLSPNHSLYWRFLDLGGARQRIEVQVGSELSPFRLRKEFVVEEAGVPHLVLDSPSASESGIAAGGRLRLAAHFEAGAVSDAAMTAYVHDVASGEVTALRLTCVEARCEDQSFLPQPGRTYRLVIAATGSSEARPFSDAAEAELATGEVVRLDGADALARMAALTPGDSPAPVPVTVTAFLYSGTPQLTAQLTDLRPLPSGLSAETFGVVLSALAPQAGGTYAAELKLRGFDRLPPGEYSAAVQFAAGEVPVVPAAVNFTLRVIRPQVRLPGLPNPLSFGLIPDLTEPQTIAVQADFGEGAPFDLAAVVTSLTSALGPESPDRIQVDLGRPEPSGSSGRFSLSLRLSVLRALPPGEYSGVLRFIPARPDNPASVEPSESRFEFRIPQPALALKRIGIPGDPVGCPQLGLRALPPGPDGLLPDLDRLIAAYLNALKAAREELEGKATDLETALSEPLARQQAFLRQPLPGLDELERRLQDEARASGDASLHPRLVASTPQAAGALEPLLANDVARLTDRPEPFAAPGEYRSLGDVIFNAVEVRAGKIRSIVPPAGLKVETLLQSNLPDYRPRSFLIELRGRTQPMLGWDDEALPRGFPIEMEILSLEEPASSPALAAFGAALKMQSVGSLDPFSITCLRVVHGLRAEAVPHFAVYAADWRHIGPTERAGMALSPAALAETGDYLWPKLAPTASFEEEGSHA